MSRLFLPVIIVMMVLGCARSSQSPIAPDSQSPTGLEGTHQTGIADGPYRLWGEWRFYFNAAHDRVDVVPRRQGRLHLNALKFLESYCTDCVQITGIKNNGDSTIDLTVKIRHPFPGHPEYTGFDVKGIIIFNGSLEFPVDESGWLPWKKPCIVSWRELGDPEVLRADGSTPRWSPSYESGSDLPIFNYWEGKYAKGEPNAKVNAYLDFYSVPERHMFLSNDEVTRTYRIWLPYGQEVVAGYAVEACWEPPMITPVKNPLEDFPVSANQPEAYHFKYIINNGEVITDPENCCGKNEDCTDLRVEWKQWYGQSPNELLILVPGGSDAGHSLTPCDDSFPDSLRPGPWSLYLAEDGLYRRLAVLYVYEPIDGQANQAFDVYDFTIDRPD